LVSESRKKKGNFFMKLKKGFTLIELLVVLFICVILASMLLGIRGCGRPSESEVIKAVEDAGYTDIKVISSGFSWSDDDTYEYKCTALNIREKPVNLRVTYTYNKGFTVRINP
jgi:prepilin-type N-terminal cleavage/methylation domain-containing protein